ncbi:sugar ABC transporter permease [Nocardioides sp. CER19]|uniref:carbohydrate ABC transporter permease n=1 Tax=Nocardioides sp. CER19 TaxID=3038538 RepID=UPI002447CF53|nr:sugar ABC transporter permease [Nocardioides sp. CER19]MDH2413169.1 sugar ABC transporter permease [Nocardioides sp. CER19]
MTTTQEVLPAETSTPVSSGPERRRRSVNALPYGLLVPATAALALALGYPLVRQVVLSFQDFGLAQQFGKPPEWVGLQNYRELVTDSYLWKVVLRSVLFCLANAALTACLGLAVALLMMRMSKVVRIAVQAGLLLAWAMPVVASMTVWTFLFDTQYGIVNWLLTHLGLDFDGHAWLLHPMSFFGVATVIVVWMSVPFVAFTMYAALTQVPEELVEAAEIDGATGGQRFRHVVLPTIRPVLYVVLLLQIIWDLRVFTQIFNLQKAGGVTEQTNLLGTFIYRQGVGGGHFGLASAAAMFMLALAVVMTAPYVRLMLKQEKEA